MSVYRFANYPDTRVYSKAFIVVHAGANWGIPMVEGLMDGGEGETLEFGKAAFQTVDWTNHEIVFRPFQRQNLLKVEVPGMPTITLERCGGRDIHFVPSVIQPSP